jgi:hypothetical protein
MRGSAGLELLAAGILLFAATASGCATRVYEGSGGGVLRVGAVFGLYDARPEQDPEVAAELAHGSRLTSGPDHSAHEGQAAALDRVLGAVLHTLPRSRAVYLAGWGEASAPQDKAPARPRPVAFARTAFLANRLAERLVLLGNTVVADPARADVWVLPWVRVLGARTTHRVYRFYQYPVYVHDEHHGTAEVSVALYDKTTGELRDLVSGKGYGIFIEPYLLDIFGFRLGF